MAEQLSLDRSKTAVLIMDYQNRQLSNFPEDFQEAIIARANTVLDKARQEGIPVLYVEVRRGERTPETEIHSSILPGSGEPRALTPLPRLAGRGGHQRLPVVRDRAGQPFRQAVLHRDAHQ